jgi:histidinol-phosphate aminotransferase
MSLAWLRPGLPRSYAFSVTELPHRAKLDQNEAAVDLPAELKRELLEEMMARPWNRYLQPVEYARAKQALAEVAGVDPDWLAITSGGDQALEAGFMIAGGPGRRARWFEPTYPYVGHAARRTATAADRVELGAALDHRLDAGQVDCDADLIALVSPNNPTGGLVADDVVTAALADPGRAVLLDEAYADYARHSWVGRVGEHDNLLVARSLSKSSLAWIHVGFVVAHPDAIAIIENLYTAPYHLNGVQLLVAARYRDIYPHVRARADEVIAERERLTAALEELEGVEPYPSRASFILFRIAGEPDRAAAVHRTLAEAGVRIRDVAGLTGLAGHLRVTLGLSDENDLFLTELARALA